MNSFSFLTFSFLSNRDLAGHRLIGDLGHGERHGNGPAAPQQFQRADAEELLQIAVGPIAERGQHGRRIGGEEGTLTR